MTTKSKILAASLAGIGVLGAGAAIARPGDQADLTRAAATQGAAAMFAQIDVNGDGQLNDADREARQEQRFAMLDADGNGAISPAEFAAAREMRGERGPDGGAGKGPGHAGAEHGMRGGKGHAGMRGAFRGAMMQNADANQDGAISQAEFTASMLARFDQADADKDGTITSAEREARRSAMRDRMQQMRDSRNLAEDAAQ